VTTQACSLETVRGRNTLRKRMPPRRTRLEEWHPQLKQVLERRVYVVHSGAFSGLGALPVGGACRAQRGPLICNRMTGTAVYEVRRARTREELAAALALRHDVFCVEQGVPERDELDGRDHEGIHLVAVREGELLATCRIVLVGTTAQFSRLAVRRSARRQGIATALLAAADEESRAGGARRIVLHAQTYARELYGQAGYRPRGRVFWEAGIEHIAMEKLLD
jgi:predicted GNAT family N-acyltransferase